jgi:hypothetical protein
MAVAGNTPDMQVVNAAHAVLFQQGLLNVSICIPGNAFHEDMHGLLQEFPRGETVLESDQYANQRST